MLQKFKTTMELRDKGYSLDGIVEIDEGFFISVETDNK